MGGLGGVDAGLCRLAGNSNRAIYRTLRDWATSPQRGVGANAALPPDTVVYGGSD